MPWTRAHVSEDIAAKSSCTWTLHARITWHMRHWATRVIDPPCTTHATCMRPRDVHSCCSHLAKCAAGISPSLPSFTIDSGHRATVHALKRTRVRAGHTPPIAITEFTCRNTQRQPRGPAHRLLVLQCVSKRLRQEPLTLQLQRILFMSRSTSTPDRSDNLASGSPATHFQRCCNHRYSGLGCLGRAPLDHCSR